MCCISVAVPAMSNIRWHLKYSNALYDFYIGPTGKGSSGHTTVYNQCNFLCELPRNCVARQVTGRLQQHIVTWTLNVATCLTIFQGLQWLYNGYGGGANEFWLKSWYTCG